MKAPDLPLLSTVSRPTIHPDGDRAVIAVTRPDLAADDYVGQLWSVRLVGDPTPVLVTRGFRDTAPRYSPDGRLLGFLRAHPGSPAQLCVVAAGGGEPVEVTQAPLGVTEFAWAPDSASLAFIAREPEYGRYGTVPGVDAHDEPARRITTLRYKANGVGYTFDRPAQVFLVRAPDVFAPPNPQPAPSADGSDVLRQRSVRSSDGVPRQLTWAVDGYDHTGLSFSPTGTSLITISARQPGRDSDLRSGLVELSIGAGQYGPALPQRIIVDHTANVRISRLGWSPDGTIYFLAQDVGESGRDFVARSTGLFRLGTAMQPLRRLTAEETIDLAESSELTFTADGSVLVQNSTRGTVQLLAVSPEGQITPLTSTSLVVTGHDCVGDQIVFSFQDAASPGDVAVLTDNHIRRLTGLGFPLGEAGILPSHDVTVIGRDGYPVHGWVVRPEERGAEGPATHPVLLCIHGGPFSQYSVALFDEAQIYAAAGYAVVMCNPRGSSGYGQAHGRAIKHGMGQLDQNDVLDFLEGVLENDPTLDSDRLVIMGGSYGGFLTAWITAHDHRFTASIIERGFLDPEAFVGTSDIGDFFTDEYAGETSAQIRRQSPQSVVGNVRTPALVMHSANDLRCPLSQSERYYAALKRGGVETELVIFPGEDHELSRKGSPRHREQRFAIVLEWLARHVPTVHNAR